jgi:hypothetical protein
VLPIAVEPDNPVVALLEGEAVAHLHRAPEPQVMRQGKDLGACVDGGSLCAIPRTVVNHSDGNVGQHIPNRPDDIPYRGFLVICRDDDK